VRKSSVDGSSVGKSYEFGGSDREIEIERERE